MPGPVLPGPAPTGLFEAYIFDMDGTVYLGEEMLPGATRLITELRRRGLPVRFLSNNPTKDPRQYAEKLDRLGLPTAEDEIVNTVVTMTRWLQTHHPQAKVFPIAEEPLVRALGEAGIAITDDPAQIDIVIASYDRTFTYAKLQIAFDALWFHGRAILVTTNPDRYCPFPGGRGEPDAAAIVAAVEACTGVKLSKNVGKPDPDMLTAALAGLDVDPVNALMVGDRLHTDIRMAADAGMPSAMVLTGDSTADEVADTEPAHRPTYVLDRVDHILPAALRAELGWVE
ncbi:HAD-IIA family hydrolase [Pseudactinotalea sp. Z1739]|uniref:HAD-IIA family hydrolase n=1 Tax=Pseudactinotalea sp. Z1739 TaxID=3413028 RepID=UPI003C7A4F35